MAVRPAAAMVLAPAEPCCLFLLASRLEVLLARLDRLQMPFAGEIRISLAEQIERAGKQDGGQAAEHHRRQDFREYFALRSAGDGGITDR